MKNTLQKEWFSILIVLIPFIYLAFIWNSLPEKVPIHWNLNGQIDDWGSRYSLIGLLFALPVLTYGIMLLVPKIDPKNKIDTMGNKYRNTQLVSISGTRFKYLLMVLNTIVKDLNFNLKHIHLRSDVKRAELQKTLTSIMNMVSSLNNVIIVVNNNVQVVTNNQRT